MKQKKTMTSIAFLLLSLGLHAQQAITPAGSEATGTGGTASYTVGQVVYTTTGTNESVAHGVQQPYEISTTLGINETTINLGLSVYPNPTSNYLQLKVTSEKVEGLTYQLYDLQGIVIESKKVSNTSTTVVMENLPTATYFLRISDNNQIVKIFKIIKSN